MNPTADTTSARLVTGSAAFVVGLLVLQSCGDDAVTAPEAGQRVVPSPEGSDRTSAELAVQNVLEQVWGSPQQLATIVSAGEVAGQEAVRNCVADAGYDYAPAPPTGGGYAGWSVMPFPAAFPMLAPLDDGTTAGLPLTMDFRWMKAYESEQATAELETAGAADDSESQAGFNAAIGKCAGALEPHLVDVNVLVDTELERELYETFAAVENSKDVQSLASSYAPCMKSQGFEVSERQELIELVQAKYVDAATGQLLAPGSEGAADALQFQKRAVEADTTCRADAHDAALKAVVAPLEKFRAENATQLDRSASAWAELAADATDELSD